MTVKQTTKTIDGVEYVGTMSDEGFYIENESGQRYAEAWDIAGSEHAYTETDVPIEGMSEEELEAAYARAGRIALGVERYE